MRHFRPDRALDLVEQALARKHKEGRSVKYMVPSLWVGNGKGAPKIVKVNPYAFYLGVVRKLQKQKLPRAIRTGDNGEWTKDAVIYNMFVRTSAAFDHNGNGKLDIPVNGNGFRETGTFLKAMAMLPYIKRMGATVVHLLPITSIGHDGNKGTLGSPYAIRNPYELDENLSEPCLGLDAKTEFRAFVEAAHRLGLRVVTEFVFRTAAKDGDWVREHPEWFYWIREDVPLRKPHTVDESSYGSPLFSRDELEHIHRDVHEGRFNNLLPPHPQYREMFTEPPLSEHVKKIDGRYVGTLADGRKVKIPGAFADWPPDDNQPPWDDVTYLRMYTNPDFNYIGYNTIRMYDARLTEQKFVNRPLWDRIVGIIPYYQKEFEIDGVMIDMGHALPMDLKHELVKAARLANPDFAFWDENFAIAQQSRDEGYNAVFGYLWHEQHIPSMVRKFCDRLSHERFPIPFFASPESHNTHRAAEREGGVAYSKWAFVFNSFLPGIPFIHSGYELAEHMPINTGLDFTHDELRTMPSERLPLFSEFGYTWTRKEQFPAFIAKILSIRAKYHAMVIDSDPRTFCLSASTNSNIIIYHRQTIDGRKRLVVAGNMNFREVEHATLALESTKRQVLDLLTAKRLPVKQGSVSLTLQPGQSVVFEY